MAANNQLAIDGGAPVRTTPLPYGRHWIDEDDIAVVAQVLRSDFLTTGPEVGRFETDFAKSVGAAEAVAVSSGTAALHAAVECLGIGPGDEVLVPTLTFAASANCVLYQGATPVLCDVDADTLLLAPEAVERHIGPRTRAIIGVDFAGQPCDWNAIRTCVSQKRLPLVADACHSLGGSDRGRPVGQLADLTVFSLHPVKHVTSGEGGVITCDDRARAEHMRTFRHHGITRPPGAEPWNYEVTSLGQNYRLTDVQCALARRQLTKLEVWVSRRREIAARYDAELASMPGIVPLARRDGIGHAYHLYVVRLPVSRWRVSRDRVLAAIRAEGILATLHYPPVHLHPFYRARLGTAPGDCPNAEAAAQEILSLPMFPLMSSADQDDVFTALHKVARAYGR